MYIWPMIGYSPPFYAKMHLMTFDLVQKPRKVKSNVTAPEVDAYGPMINNSHGVFHYHAVPPGPKFQVLTASL